MVWVRYLTCKISIGRIVKFLSEPEVDDEISSFKIGGDNFRREGTDVTLLDADTPTPTITKSDSKAKANIERIGISNGNFLWSEPALPKPDDKPAQKPWYRRRFWVKQPPVLPAAPPATVTQPLLDDAMVTQALLATEVQIVNSTDLETGSRRSVNEVLGEGATVKNERQFKLKDINVYFPPGQLSVVTGPTASGKTALLRALLGEMYTIPPPTISSAGGATSTSDSASITRIHLPKHPWVVDSSTGLRDYISYAAQTPWLEHLSIKDNILFGSVYDEERYQAVLECCALKPDLDTFEDGDRTEIGERGVSLSGGQKARWVPNFPEPSTFSWLAIVY
jgi:ABC-type multidrug transport system fused ATPase/permease subunit